MASGRSSSATNAVIPGAGVPATNTQTTAKYETVSTETGNYTLAQLPAGTYDLTVELPGFMAGPNTFPFPVRRLRVPGAFTRNVIDGDKSVESGYINAARELEEMGARRELSHAERSWRSVERESRDFLQTLTELEID